MRRLLLAAALIASALPVSAQEFYESAGGSWSVIGLGDSCIALNRSPVEFNLSPYNGVVLHQFKSDNLPRLQAYFWPGAFTEGAAVTLTVTPEGREPTDLVAEAVTGFQLVSKDMAPEDLLEAMSNVPTVTVKASGIDQILLFETTPIEAVADLMGKCINGAPAAN